MPRRLAVFPALPVFASSFGEGTPAGGFLIGDRFRAAPGKSATAIPFEGVLSGAGRVAGGLDARPSAPLVLPRGRGETALDGPPNRSWTGPLLALFRLLSEGDLLGGRKFTDCKNLVSSPRTPRFHPSNLASSFSLLRASDNSQVPWPSSL